MLELAGYIHGLMLEHDCVSIPGFGGMVAQRFRSEINPGTNIMRPPSKRISYHKDLVANSHLLLDKIAREKNLPTHKVSLLIADEVNAWKQELAAGNSIKLEGVGRFYLDKEGFVCFNQSLESNFDLNAFGLEMFRATAIKRNDEIKEAVTVAIAESVKKTNKSFSIWRAAAVFAGIGALLAVGFFKSDVSLQDNLRANFNPLHYSKTIETPALNPNTDLVDDATNAEEITAADETVAFEDVELNTIATPKVEEKSIVAIPSENAMPFQVIVGSFTEISNANELVMDLKSKGYDPSVIQDGSAFSKVSIQGFSNRSEAVQAMRAYKLSVNKGAWIYKR